jgi:hypothetical protein
MVVGEADDGGEVVEDAAAAEMLLLVVEGWRIWLQCRRMDIWRYNIPQVGAGGASLGGVKALLLTLILLSPSTGWYFSYPDKVTGRIFMGKYSVPGGTLGY